MRERLLVTLSSYLGGEYDATLLGVIVDKVIGLVKLHRNYPSTMTTTQIDADLERYEAKIFEIVLAYFTRVGVEGELTHSENNVKTHYFEDEKLFSFITPIARCI